MDFSYKLMEELTIRKATHKDIDALVGLLEELFSIEKDYQIDAARQRTGLEMLLHEQRSFILVAVDKNKVVGMVSVQMVISTAEGGLSAWIEDMIITSSCRRKGAGKKLLTYALKAAEEAGALRAQLLTDKNNQAALAYYEKLGWQATSMIAKKMKLK